MQQTQIALSITDSRLTRQILTALDRYPAAIAPPSSPGDPSQWLHSSDLLILEPPQSAEEDGLRIAADIRKRDRGYPIILVTTRGSESLAIAALRIGVADYFKAPIVADDFMASIRRCLSDRSTDRGAGACCEALAGMVGASPGLSKLRDYLRKVGKVDSPALITGETGTGKELAAKTIHECSSRRSYPMISINCAAIPENLLESELFGYERGAFTGAHSAFPGKLRLAHGGTVFLDEIGDLPLHGQAKLLRAIENKEITPLGSKRSHPVDVRFIAATNASLEKLVGAGRFRADLFYRLNIARIHLPPLRERQEDIPLLLNHFVAEFNRRTGSRVRGFGADAAELLAQYAWPGNIRELRNLVETIFIDPPAGWIHAGDLPPGYFQHGDGCPPSNLREMEMLVAALDAVNWNKSRAAEQLGCSRMTLYRKLAKYGLSNLCSPLSPI